MPLSLPLLALALASTAAGGGTAARLDAELGQHPAGPARAVWSSRLLLGAPYRLSPLGDQEGPHTGPRFRLDAFDCVTYVETVIALANSQSTSEATRLLDDIRYHGPPDYAHRNHYMEAQWIPDNLKKGWIEEATRAVAGTATERVTTQLTPAAWRSAEQARRVLPELPAEHRPLGTFSVDLIPLARVTELAPRIPEGTVLFVLRESRPWRPFNVSHAGVVVAGQRGERYLRHASDVPRVLRVRDEPLERFLARNARYQGWRVIGVALFTIRDNSQRASELMGRAAQEPREQPSVEDLPPQPPPSGSAPLCVPESNQDAPPAQ